MKDLLVLIDHFARDYWDKKNISKSCGVKSLVEAVNYSINNGGKRFRPLLSLHVAETLGGDKEKTLPFACAVEFVHTFSLIHDDLPSMDNDDLRRGQPSNHRVFGEDTALLAGDALLAEAFCVVAKHYSYNSDLVVKLVQLLGKSSGIEGMVGGQAIDLKVQVQGLENMAQLNELHSLKTGALISCAIEGAALICQAEEKDMESLKNYGRYLGLAFQVADDILDYDLNDIEKGSYPGLVGIDESRVFLKKLSDKARQSVEFNGKTNSTKSYLKEIIDYNESRIE